MKFSEKLLLIKAGATLTDIKKLEEEEAAEIEASKNHDEDKNNQDDEKNSSDDEKNSSDDEKKELLTALEAANLALEQSKNALDAKTKEYEKLNEEFLKLTNSQTVNDNVTKTGADVFAELFNNSTKEE